MTMLSMSTSDLANCSLRLSSETILRRFASCAARSVAWRFSAIWRAVRSSDATRKRSPAVGTDVRPSTCTGVDGVASFMWLPFSSSMARTRPYEVPATMASPMRRVPCCTSTVATAPRPLSKSGFDGGASGVHIRVRTQVEVGVGREQHGFEQLVDVGALLGGNVDEHGVAAVLLRHEAELGELATDLLRGSRPAYRSC